tara:strand:+ start:7974 stop:9218 length:1245 start_codon:yes stop_codon:yes gene_type:complete
MEFKKRFSIAHPEQDMQQYPNHYYLILKNTPKETLDEIEDIYFGKNFYYEFRRQRKFVGNAMGQEATDEHIDNLLRIQDELGVEVSLTVNQTIWPDELILDETIQNQFVEWVGQYYDKGLRSCTISSKHLMRTKKLQHRCPKMKWKNTVNHIISDGQQVADTIGIGYDTILLDRSLNRNIKELRRINKFIQRRNGRPIRTSLLVSEGCLYRCPFKLEHDMASTVIGAQYWGGDNALSSLSCNNWKSDKMDQLPRNGIDMVTTDKEMLDQYLDKKVGGVDILKTSGRFDGRLYNRYTETEIRTKNIKLQRQFGPLTSSTFQNVYDTNAIPFDRWLVLVPTEEDDNLTKEGYQKFYEEHLKDNIWLSEKGKRLNRILLNCKSQCYDCHECERTFDVPDYDTSIKEIDAELRYARLN